MQLFVSANPSTTCCDSISRSVSESSGSQTAAEFYYPSYENRLLASTRAELNAALGMYGSPYAAAAAAGQNYANYFSYSTDASSLYSTLVHTKDCKEEKDLQLSDLEDMNDGDCDKVNSDCEKVSQEELSLQQAMAAELLKRGCISALPLPNSFHTLACGNKRVTALPSEFLDPTMSKSSPAVPMGTAALSHLDVPEKPRIWLLARTAATDIGLGLHPGSKLRTGNISLDCQLPTVKLTMTGSGQCRELGSPDKTNLPSVEASFEVGLQSQKKVYGVSGFTQKPLHCSSYPVSSDTCQYSSVEGFCRKSEAESSALSDTCLTLQEDMLTAFRPGMKR
ncbi:hypothetical protein SKAU_G00410650 [Synaphobranchus kaupii]|uniref:Uncharacterized protein n=1 Tax=Synaphobranchus kaupii TaxID=118154 RepID=A0A9Q1E7P1_SYNKA|nr:hypothetical protein SKAU_G00410650 [Synaphobranchus kaupii]